MHRLSVLVMITFWFGAATLHLCGAQTSANAAQTYLGFDRNIYPGDEAMTELRKTFSYASYWLSAPPGEKENTWHVKRSFLRSKGFGFLVLYRGRDSAELKTNSLATRQGVSDATSAIASAQREGFSPGTILFLDIEEGGRLSAAYHSYLRAWTITLAKAGYRSGVYCSGIPVQEEPSVSITTAADIRDHAKDLDITFWVYNDACPPSPGCAPTTLPLPSSSGIPFAAIWQFAQSPKRKEFTAHCPANYHRDGNCYAPNDAAHKWFLDLNVAQSPDPSNGAK